MLKKSFLMLWAVALLAAGSSAQANSPHKFEGTITAINRTANPPTVTVRVGSRTVVVRLTSRTKIKRDDDRQGTLADLAVGQEVEVKVHPRTGEVQDIKVEDDGDDDDGDDQDEREFVGTIVSATATELVLNVNGRLVTVSLNDQTQVRLGDLRLDPSRLADLVGLRVKVEVNGANVAREVKIDLPSISLVGRIVSIDPSGRVTLRVAGRNYTLTLPEDIVITFRGERLRFSDLLVGDLLRLQVVLLDALRGFVLRAEVDAQPRQVVGTLTAVNGSTLTVNTRQGPVTLNIGSQTSVKVNGRTVTLAQLKTMLDQAIAARRQIHVTAHTLVRGATSTTVFVNANVHHGGRR